MYSIPFAPLNLLNFAMNKILYSKFDKTKIGDLPRAVFPGRIITILSPGEAQRAVDYLLQSDIRLRYRDKTCIQERREK